MWYLAAVEESTVTLSCSVRHMSRTLVTQGLPIPRHSTAALLVNKREEKPNVESARKYKNRGEKACLKMLPPRVMTPVAARMARASMGKHSCRHRIT